MKKVIILASIFVVLVISGAAVWAMSEKESKTYSWRYKMIVSVETPEGIKTGSAVREMGNDTRTDFPTNTNPAKVRGEAVVVDLGERGVLFALISHRSDDEFCVTFPLPGRQPGNGCTTEAGVKYHASLPLGTKSAMNPAEVPTYPNLVTFTDMKDPKSVILLQEWGRGDDGYHFLKKDRFEEIFGQGVKLKDITLEITDEDIVWKIEKYLGQRHAVGPYEFVKGK